MAGLTRALDAPRSGVDRCKPQAAVAASRSKAIAMRLLAIIWAFVRAAVEQEVAYRAELLGNLVRSLIGIGTTIGGIAVIFAHTRTLGGWSLDQALALLGIFTMVNGLVASVLSPSLNKVVEEVRDGTFDYILLKPVPSLFLASTRRLVVWHVADVLLGLAILLLALTRLEVAASGWGLAMFGLVMASGLTIVYAIWLALTSLVFWFVRVENITMIFNLFFQTGRYPVEVYPIWLRQVLTFVFPVAFITTVPAQTITGREPAVFLWLAPLIAALSVMVAIRFWHLGLSRYTSASS